MLRPVKLLQRFENVNAGEVAGFAPDVCDRLIAAGAAEPYKPDAPAAEKKAPAPKPPVQPVRKADAAVVEIPADWQRKNSADMVALAAQLVDVEPANRNAAITVIEAELAERAKQP